MNCFRISDYYDYDHLDKYFALRSMLKASGFVIVRDDKVGGTYACMDSNDAESVFNNVLNEWRTKLSDFNTIEIISEEKNNQKLKENWRNPLKLFLEQHK